MVALLRTGPPSTPRLLLAHGCRRSHGLAVHEHGCRTVAAAGIEVIRFEFEYMAKGRDEGTRPGPDRAPKLIARFNEVLGLVGPADEIIIGGKSMGGENRVDDRR